MKIAVIVDNLKVSHWQAQALLRLQHCTELLVYNCTNTPPNRKRVRNALYYVLNLCTIRNRQTRSVPMPRPDDVPFRSIDFRSAQDGSWQRLPEALLRQIADDKPVVILKFGMSLLRIPDQVVLKPPILSYHHGDPDAFRGRPAGFYELTQDRPAMGQIVQILSNKLDGGRVVAFAETRVHRHSYKATLEEAFRHSPLLINQAIACATRGASLDMASNGPVYRLPSNWAVIRFCLALMIRLVSRLAYGLFIEKAWQVSTATSRRPEVEPPFLHLPDRSEWRTIKVPPGYSFIADPFFEPCGEGIIVEGLHASSGKGGLVHIEGANVVAITEGGRHLSYPGSIAEEGKTYFVPEIAQWSSPKLFELREQQLREAGALKLPGAPRVLDPTLYRRGDSIFLFGNIASEGQSVLRLWHAPSLHTDFVEHPLSPILISPKGGRMAGHLVEFGGRLFRLGQYFGRHYGEGLFVFEIEALGVDEYRERRIASIAFESVRGPHTLNVRGRELLFDWYTSRLSLLAGVRRLRGRMN